MIDNKDCLEYLEGLKGESVDLVLTDPPYFIGFDGGKGWDSQWKTEDEYLSGLETTCQQALVPTESRSPSTIPNWSNQRFPRQIAASSF